MVCPHFAQAVQSHYAHLAWDCSWGRKRPRRFGTDCALSARPQRSAVTSFAHLCPQGVRSTVVGSLPFGFSACEIKDFFAPFALRFSRNGGLERFRAVRQSSSLCRHVLTHFVPSFCSNCAVALAFASFGLKKWGKCPATKT